VYVEQLDRQRVVEARRERRLACRWESRTVKRSVGLDGLHMHSGRARGRQVVDGGLRLQDGSDAVSKVLCCNKSSAPSLSNGRPGSSDGEVDVWLT
jgi:hypothetical protein